MGSRWASIEKSLRGQYGPNLAGVDEVGRGPLAGPVVACAIIMPAGMRAIAGVDDSKRLSAEVRQRLAAQIQVRAVRIGLGAASSREIDRINILQATTLAMRRAVRALGMTPDHIVVDGRPVKLLGSEHTAVVGGDAKCYSVACASIVAKVTRDRLMTLLAARYPHYGWDHNAGYATVQHQVAIDTHGATPHHRATFCTKQLTLDFSV